MIPEAVEVPEDAATEETESVIGLTAETDPFLQEEAKAQAMADASSTFNETLLEADEDGLAELRLWLFKQNCQLEYQQSMLDERIEQFESEKRKFQEDKERAMQRIERERDALYEKDQLAEQKLEMLREAYDRLDEDRRRLEQDEKRIEKEKSYLEAATYYNPDAELFFCGVNSLLAVKKRYKDLIKIYHPDNICGDNRVIQMINQEYESLLSAFQMNA